MSKAKIENSYKLQFLSFSEEAFTELLKRIKKFNSLLLKEEKFIFSRRMDTIDVLSISEKKLNEFMKEIKRDRKLRNKFNIMDGPIINENRQ